jgi:hypothetical protein
VLQAMLVAGVLLLNTQLALPPERVNVELLRATVFPGKTLPPGWYLFSLGRSVGGQALIDIYSSDGSRLLLTCLTVESELPKPAMLNVASYPGTAPPVMRVWFRPGNPRGYEFVYPAGDAWSVFEQSAASVPFTPSRTFEHELIGTYDVRRTGSDPSATAVVGTSGSAGSATRGPMDFLVAARLLMAARIKSGDADEAGRLRVFDQQLMEISKDYRERRPLDEKLARFFSALSNAMLRPATSDRSATLALERIHAHIDAFRRAVVQSK